MFLGKIYTADKNFTRPPVAIVATNFKFGRDEDDDGDDEDKDLVSGRTRAREAARCVCAQVRAPSVLPGDDDDDIDDGDDTVLAVYSPL